MGYTAVRRLILDRVGLLRLLGVVPAWSLFVLIVGMLVVCLLPAATAVAVAWLVERVAEAMGGNREGFQYIAPALVVVGLLLTADQVAQSLVVPYRDWVASRVNGEIRRLIRRSVVGHRGIEDLESQETRDAASLPVSNVFLFNIGAGAEGQLWLIARIVGAVAAALIVARYSWLSAVIVLLVVATQRALLRRHYASAIASSMVDTASDGRAATYWSETIGTARGGMEMRLFGFGSWSVDRFVEHAEVPVRELARVLLGARRLHLAVFVLNVVAVVVPFVLLSSLAINGEIDATGLTAALGGVVAVTRVFSAMGFEAFSIEAAVSQLAAVDQLREGGASGVGASSGDTSTFNGTSRLANVRSSGIPTIAFEDVRFRYPGSDRAVLDGLNLIVRPGESVALVGANGAGKTTILKLLAGFYEPTDGRILVSGVDLAAINIDAWRQELAIVFQEFARLELSALENVALADLSRRDVAAVADAAVHAAGAAALIDDLPKGWDTILSRAFTGGTDLSGGQWQRIALSRAMYAAVAGASVLILDEPTASLDVQAEVALFDRLLAQAGERTSILVSHRFSTVRRAGRIVVIEDGTVAEDGSHEELHASNGIYTRLYDLQSRRFMSGDRGGAAR